MKRFSDIVILDMVKVSGVSQILQETDPGKLFKGFWESINNAPIYSALNT